MKIEFDFTELTSYDVRMLMAFYDMTSNEMISLFERCAPQHDHTDPEVLHELYLQIIPAVIDYLANSLSFIYRNEAE